MKRIFPLTVLTLAMLFLFAAQAEGIEKEYTHWGLISTDTLTESALACTLFNQTHRVFPDSTYWHFGFSAYNAAHADSVDLDIDAYWSPFEVIFKKGTRIDSISGPWTDKQDVVANYATNDYVLTMYSGELISKYFEWNRIIITGAANCGTTIVKTYIGYRKFWYKE